MKIMKFDNFELPTKSPSIPIMPLVESLYFLLELYASCSQCVVQSTIKIHLCPALYDNLEMVHSISYCEPLGSFLNPSSGTSTKLTEELSNHPGQNLNRGASDIARISRLPL